MATLADKFASVLASKAFNVLYDTVRGSGLVNGNKESQLLQALESMKPIFSHGGNRLDFFFSVSLIIWQNLIPLIGRVVGLTLTSSQPYQSGRTLTYSTVIV